MLHDLILEPTGGSVETIVQTRTPTTIREARADIEKLVLADDLMMAFAVIRSQRLAEMAV